MQKSNLKITSVEFMREVRHIKDLLKDPMPEVAIAGRSNVGKSTLINVILGTKAAKTSQTPGKTRGVNYFKINGSFCLVDLPGYGYAKVNKKEKQNWGPLIEAYITSSRNLKVVTCLVDIRRGLLDSDIQLFEWLSYMDKKFVVVLTKSDKLSRSKIKETVNKVSSYFTGDVEIIPFSSLKKEGKQELWNTLNYYLK